MSWTPELAANLLAGNSPAGAKKWVAFPTSKPPPGSPGRIILSMNSPFNSGACEWGGVSEGFPEEMTIWGTAEGNLLYHLSWGWFSQKLCSSGRVLEASPRKTFHFWNVSENISSFSANPFRWGPVVKAGEWVGFTPVGCTSACGSSHAPKQARGRQFQGDTGVRDWCFTLLPLLWMCAQARRCWSW